MFNVIFRMASLVLSYFLSSKHARCSVDAVEYEETGWYDGETFVKSPELLMRDRLLGTYEVSDGGRTAPDWPVPLTCL
jgi:hypothetical protein